MPPDHMARAAEPALMARARAELAARMCGNGAFQLSEMEQEVWVVREARRAALFATPVGRAIGRIYGALTELCYAMRAFSHEYPAPEDIRPVLAAGLREAGLTEPEPRYGYGPDHFASLPDQIIGWSFMIDMMSDLLADMEPPDDAEDGEEAEREAA